MADFQSDIRERLIGCVVQTQRLPVTQIYGQARVENGRRPMPMIAPDVVPADIVTASEAGLVPGV